jgi:hypothetical protein
MFNQHPYNQRWYEGTNEGRDLSTPPTYSTSLITALAHIESGLSIPKVVMGGKGGTNANEYGLFKKSNNYSYNLWRSKRYNVGRPFNFVGARIPLTDNLTTDTRIVPVLNFDDGDQLVRGNVIDLYHYPDGPAYIELSAFNFGSNSHGEKNLALEFHFIGYDLIGVSLPIEIDIEIESQG